MLQITAALTTTDAFKPIRILLMSFWILILLKYQLAKDVRFWNECGPINYSRMSDSFIFGTNTTVLRRHKPSSSKYFLYLYFLKYDVSETL